MFVVGLLTPDRGFVFIMQYHCCEVDIEKLYFILRVVSRKITRFYTSFDFLYAHLKGSTNKQNTFMSLITKTMRIET